MRTWFDLPITTRVWTAGWFIQNRMQVSLNGTTSVLTSNKKHSNGSPFAFQNRGIAVLGPPVSSSKQSTVNPSRAPGTTIIDITDGDVPSLENWNTHKSRLQRRHWRNLHWEIPLQSLIIAACQLFISHKASARPSSYMLSRKAKYSVGQSGLHEQAGLGLRLSCRLLLAKQSLPSINKPKALVYPQESRGRFGWNRFIKPRQERSQIWNQNSTGHRSSYSFHRK